MSRPAGLLVLRTAGLTLSLASALTLPNAVAQQVDPRVIADMALAGNTVRFVTLRAATVYRVEVTPAQATVVLRLRARFREPPLRTFPTGDPPPANGHAFNVAPATSGQYALEVNTTGEPVRVRVLLDGTGTEETRRIAQGGRRPLLGVSLRAVFESGFQEYSTGHLTYRQIPVRSTTSTGVEVCFVAVPRGVRSFRGAGGCIVSVGAFSRSYGRSYLAVGVAPRMRVVGHGETGGVSVTGQLRLAQSTGTLGNGWVTFLGGGLMYGYPVTDHSEIEMGVSLVRVDGSGGAFPRPSDTFVQVGVGVTAHR